jgi:hypothetical protein
MVLSLSKKFSKEEKNPKIKMTKKLQGFICPKL